MQQAVRETLQTCCRLHVGGLQNGILNSLGYPLQGEEMMKAFFVTVFFLSTFVSPCSWAFTPDLIRGCTAIAEERKSTLGEDAVHAAYCLGVLDGIMTATFQRQKPVPLPYP
jgi:hypothetical protein